MKKKKKSWKIHGSHRVFLHEAAIQRPSTTVEEVRRPKQEMPRPNSRRQLAKTGWYNPSTCRCCTSRSSSASCCSRCATCNRNYICSDLPATGTEEMKRTWEKRRSAILHGRWNNVTLLRYIHFSFYTYSYIISRKINARRLINFKDTFVSIIGAHHTTPHGVIV